jgi:hypothetical protein
MSVPMAFIAIGKGREVECRDSALKGLHSGVILQSSFSNLNSLARKNNMF